MITNEGRVFDDEYKGHSFAPGYRDVSLQFEINDGVKAETIEIQLSKDNALRLLRDLLNVQEVAWQNSEPIDMEPHEVQLRAQRLFG